MLYSYIAVGGSRYSLGGGLTMSGLDAHAVCFLSSVALPESYEYI